MSNLLKSKSHTLSKQTLHYFEFGSVNMNGKATILLIHGHFSSKQVWNMIIEDLYLRYDGHVVAVDLRGFGESTYNQKCNELKDWADDLVQLCSVMKIEKCIPIGWSFGGLTSMKIAEIAPKLIDKLVLVASVGFQGMDLTNILQSWQYVKVLIQTKKRQELFEIFVQSGEDPKIYEDLLEGTIKQRCIDDIHKVLQTKSINIQEIKPILKNSLAIHGLDDQVVNIETFQETGKYCKKFLKLDKMVHLIPMKYDKIVDVIIYFI